MGHVHRLHAEQGVGHAVLALGAEPAARQFQRVAGGHPFHGLGEVFGLIDLGLLAGGHQPGADVLGEYHHGARVDQPLVAGLGQVGVELQAQALDALVILGEQLRLHAQQVAALGRLALVEHDLAAQVGQVVAHRAALRPTGIAGEEDHQDEEDQLAHKGRVLMECTTG